MPVTTERNSTKTLREECKEEAIMAAIGKISPQIVSKDTSETSDWLESGGIGQKDLLSVLRQFAGLFAFAPVGIERATTSEDLELLSPPDLHPPVKLRPDRQRLLEQVIKIRRSIGPVSTNVSDILRELDENST